MTNNKEDIKNLSELFDKYKIDIYYQKKSSTTKRVENLKKIFFVFFVSVLIGIFIFYIFLPPKLN